MSEQNLAAARPDEGEPSAARPEDGEPIPGLDPAEFPCLSALAHADATGTLANELRRFARQARPRSERQRTVTVARLEDAARSVVVVVQDMSSSGVRVRVDRRHEPLVDGRIELVVNDGSNKVGLPVEFVRVAARDERDIDLAYRFARLDDHQRRLIDELKGSGLFSR